MLRIFVKMHKAFDFYKYSKQVMIFSAEVCFTALGAQTVSADLTWITFAENANNHLG